MHRYKIQNWAKYERHLSELQRKKEESIYNRVYFAAKDVALGKLKFVRNWEELSEATSETHVLKIDLKFGNGYIYSNEYLEAKKNGTDDDFGWEHMVYLSTHTFYGSNHMASTKILLKHGFNVILANWDDGEID